MRQVHFVSLRPDGVVESRGNTDEVAFASMVPLPGMRLVEIPRDLAVAPLDRLDPDTGEVSPPNPAPPPDPPQATVQQRRALAYPPVTELADALYWRERGQPAQFDAWLAACDAVKATIPKT